MSRISLLTCSFVSDTASPWMLSTAKTAAPATSKRATMMAMGLTAPRLKLPSSEGKAWFMGVLRTGRTIPQGARAGGRQKRWKYSVRPLRRGGSLPESAR